MADVLERSSPKPKPVKIIWEYSIPPARFGRWRQGRKQGHLGSVWEGAKGVWWASADGIETWSGDFVDAHAAMQWVEENAKGLPKEGE
jgi:hypothetical protein